MIASFSSPRAVSTAMLLGAMLLVAPPLRADVATLKSGRSIEVSGFRLNGDLVELSLPGGGQIALPAGEVLEIHRLPLQTPPAAPAASAPAGAVPVATAPPTMETPAPGGTAEVPQGALAPVVPAASVPQAPGAVPAVNATEPDLLPKGATDKKSLREMASRIAKRHGVAEPLVHAVIEVESRYNPKAISRAGAMGLMQLMPKTADRFSVADAFDPVQNVDAGVRYLKELLARYSGEVRLALAAYNAGEEAVERHGGIPPYRETINYVRRVQRAAAH